MADERARERILVLPVEEVEPPYAISRDGLHPPDYGYSNHYQFHRPQPTPYQRRMDEQQYPRSEPLIASETPEHQASQFHTERVSPGHSPIITHSPISGPLRPTPTASTSETVKSKTPEPSLWAVPPQHLLESSSHSESTNTSSTTSVPLWHIPPPNSSQTNSSATSFEAETSHGDLWPVDEDHPEYQETVASKDQKQSSEPVQDTESEESRMFHTVEYTNDEPAAAKVDKNSRAGVRSVHFASPGTAAYTPPDEELEALSLNDEPRPGRARNGSHLQIEIPSNDLESVARSPRTPRSRTPVSATSNTSPTVSASQDAMDAEEEIWGERPSIEKLYRDIDKYLPGHDLDKEIVIDTQTAAAAANSPAPRRLQGHKKSIRVVAREAQEAHRNWRQAMNVVRVNNILRRRSTKMWGRKVEQVKPGMVIEANTIAKDAHTAAQPGDKPSK